MNVLSLKKPSTENERLLASVLLVFVVYFGTISLLSLIFGEEETATIARYRMTLSFLLSMLFGVGFFFWTKPKEIAHSEQSALEKNLAVLERALSEDEILLLRMIKESGGVTQDSLRFRSGFSKSKVSALLLNLEKNGVIFRQPLGKTYKVYLSEWLKK